MDGSLVASKIVLASSFFLRGPLLPTKTCQTRQIACKWLIPLSESLAGCSKKPAKRLPNTCQKPDKSLAAIILNLASLKQNSLLMFILFCLLTTEI